MRVHFAVSRMTYKEADILLYFLNNTKNITFAKVYERTADAVIEYKGKRTDIINTLRRFHYEDIEVPAAITDNSSRQVNAEYQEKLVTKIALHYATRFFMPLPVRALMVISKSFKYLGNGIRTLLRHKIEVPVLDATAIGVSILRDDIGTAGSIMFMARYLKNGHIKNPLVTSQEVCHLISAKYGCRLTEKKFLYPQMTLNRETRL